MTTFIVLTSFSNTPQEIKAEDFEQVSREHPIVVKFVDANRNNVALITGVISITVKEEK